MTHHITNSNPGLTSLKQSLEKNLKLTFARPSKNAVEKKKGNNANFKAFCLTPKRNNLSQAKGDNTVCYYQLL